MRKATNTLRYPYDPQKGAIICDRIAKGESLTAICKDVNLPSITTVFRWLDTEGNESFVRDYTRARQLQGHAAYLEIQEVERRMQVPKKVSDPDNEGKLISNPEYLDPNTGRVLIDSIKWRAGRMLPKTYGDKLDLDVSGDVNVVVKDTFK
jgi:hypothetical protein